MGYYVRISESSVVLPQENLSAILKQWHEINKPEYNHMKRGGSYSGGQQTEYWYSWLPADYDKTTTDPREVLELLGFEFSDTENGGIKIESYDSKTGQEDIFFKTISHLVEPNGLIVWSGEDGAQFAWYFNEGKMEEITPHEAHKKQKKYQQHMDSVVEKANSLIDTIKEDSKIKDENKEQPKKGKRRYNL